jgi:hypothetical protein
MGGNGALRNRVLEAIQRGKLPDRPPDRMSGGLGSGVCCAVCGERINVDQLEFELEFTTSGNGERPAYYHVHLACHAAWKSECPTVEFSRGTVKANELSRAAGDTTFGRDEREPSGNGGPA